MNYKWWIAGGLILSMLAVCGLSVAVLAVTVTRFSESGLRFTRFRFDTVSAESTEEQRFTVGEPARLVVESDAGEVTVTAGDTAEIVVSIHRTAWGATQAEAELARDALQVTLTPQGDTLTVRFEHPSEVISFGNVRGGTVDFVITVPAETAVNVDTRFGDVALTGTTGDADLRTSFGAIEASDVTGALKAQTSSGRITARRIRAGTEAIELESSFGGVTLESAEAGRVAVHSSSGALTVTDVQAAVSVTADTDFGGVTLEQVETASYDLKSNSGDMTVDGASGALKVHTDFGSIKVTKAQTVGLDLKTNSGQIEFAGSLGEGPHSVQTDFGTVRLSLPEDSRLAVDLKTSFGKVSTAFSITLDGEVEATHLQGNINGGGETLIVETNSGDIKLDILKP
jgi:DUF4097 and DUF4098 domain-containing protein YvlB